MAPTTTRHGRFPVVGEPAQDVHGGIGSRDQHRAVAYNMARVTTIEREAIVTRMLAFGISYWLEPSMVDILRRIGIDLHGSRSIIG